MSIPKVYYEVSPMMGADPEFFFEKEGKIIGAEKILPKKGLITDYGGSKFIIDGVQAELNPRPNHCRANLANEFRICFTALRNTLKKHDVSINVSANVEISKEELASLDAANQQFGCAPSKNTHDASASITVNPLTYLNRGAGGHLHFGVYDGYYTKTLLDRSEGEPNVKYFVKLMDYMVGNTCVLLDTNPGNIERRKHYGRAGEYRTPKHGVEYRTLSNFWLRAYPLMSFVFGMGRHALLMADQKRDFDFLEEFESRVPMDKIVRAIQDNDFDLAMRNYQAIKGIIVESCDDGSSYCITKSTYEFFELFVEKGMDYWFGHIDTVDHWCNLPDGHAGGFFDYMVNEIGAEVSAEKIRKANRARRHQTVPMTLV